MAKLLKENEILVRSGFGFVHAKKDEREGWEVNFPYISIDDSILESRFYLRNGINGWFRTERFPDRGKRFRLERFIPAFSGWAKEIYREVDHSSMFNNPSRVVEGFIGKPVKVVHFKSDGPIEYCPEGNK